jgi:hypothetical protein
LDREPWVVILLTASVSHLDYESFFCHAFTKKVVGAEAPEDGSTVRVGLDPRNPGER